MANETWKFVQAKSKQAMKQVLGIKNEAARMKVTPPLAVAPLAHGDDIRWNPNDNGNNRAALGDCKYVAKAGAASNARPKRGPNLQLPTCHVRHDAVRISSRDLAQQHH